MTLTDAQRRVLVDCSDGDWHTLVPHHERSVVAKVYAYNLIRCDNDHDRYENRIWTITPRGDELIRGKFNGA